MKYFILVLLAAPVAAVPVTTAQPVAPEGAVPQHVGYRLDLDFADHVHARWRLGVQVFTEGGTLEAVVVRHAACDGTPNVALPWRDCPPQTYRIGFDEPVTAADSLVTVTLPLEASAPRRQSMIEVVRFEGTWNGKTVAVGRGYFCGLDDEGCPE